jgi:hypothetical protein
MNANIISHIQSIEISHTFARDYRHGIETIHGWDMFEPTRFIYAFFAFNMLYELDWKKTLNGSNIQKLAYNGITHAKPQIEKLVEFISESDSKVFDKALLKIDSNRELYGIISNMEFDKNSNKTSHLDESKKIAQEFKESAKKFSAGITLNEEDHFKLLEMSYAVRNNLFHGEKKAYKMKEQGHRNRLFHYGNIILATNESFFEVIKEQYNYRRIEKWEVQDNL